MHNSSIIKCIIGVAQCFIDSEDEIESLDRYIGDGDHYINIKRGSLLCKQLNQILRDFQSRYFFQKIGMTLMSSIGGHQGPYLPSFLSHFLNILKMVIAFSFSCTFAWRRINYCKEAKLIGR